MTGIITVPFHVGDFLSGTLHMDTLEKGAYIMLLLAHYQAGETGLPDDDKKLARIAGVTAKVWNRIRPVLEEKFDVSGDFWVSKKCVEVLRKVHEQSSAQRAKALKRHNADDATAKPRQCQPKPKPIEDTNVSSPPNPPEKNIPEWIDPEIWDEYRQHRKQMGKKLTATAESRAIAKLDRFRSKGHDPTEVIRQTLENGWTGLFEIKEENIGKQHTDNQLEGFGRAAAKHAAMRSGGAVQAGAFADDYGGTEALRICRDEQDRGPPDALG